VVIKSKNEKMLWERGDIDKVLLLLDITERDRDIFIKKVGTAVAYIKSQRGNGTSEMR